MRKSLTLTAKLVATGVIFLGLALLSIGLTLWIGWNLEGGAAAVNEAGRLRMTSYRLALNVSAEPNAGQPLPALAASFDGSLELLRTGDPTRPLFVPWSNATRQRFDVVRRQWQELRPRWIAGGLPRAAVLADADRFVHQIDDFVAAIEDELAYWTGVLHLFQLTMMVVAIGSAMALLYAGYRLVLQPVARLKQGVTALREGDLGARVEVDTPDEFGDLSAGFNAMAGHLQSLYASLEDRVREKTARLEAEQERLANLYEVAAFAAKATQLDELAQGFAKKLRHISRADATAVRWSDEDNDRYVLLAHDNLPPIIAVGESCLDTSHCFCGPSREEANTRVIPILSTSPSPLGHCNRAGYATVVSVPIKLHDRLMGEVDLFFRKSVVLGEEERSMLDTLASHLAGAMEALRAAALSREAAVAQERSMIARELHDSIAQSLIFLRIQTQLLRETLNRGDLEAASPIMAELETGVRESYADVRELLLHFRTRTSEESIEPALRTTLSKFEHQTGLRTHLQINARGIALPPDVQVQVLHIVQEALSNVRKHAQASQVWLEVASTPTWRFEVRDNGRGFDPAQALPDSTHVGLRIMQERADRIGARVTLETAPGQGCSVVLQLPETVTTEAVPLPQEATA